MTASLSWAVSCGALCPMRPHIRVAWSPECLRTLVREPPTFCPSSPSVGRSITSPQGLSQDSALWLTLSRRSISPLLVTASSFSSPSSCSRSSKAFPNTRGKPWATKFSTTFAWTPPSHSSRWKRPTTICGKPVKSCRSCPLTSTNWKTWSRTHPPPSSVLW